MKLVFMGTPDFSVPALESLIAGGHEVAAVVTQPDKPKGRGNVMQYPPVKETALKYGIPVYQPVKVKTDEDFLQTMEAIAPDCIVVVAFGQILPKRLLDLPKYGCINIHASLLPKYRGAAPIQWVIIDGEKTTGVTTMKMDVGLDTGDMMDKIEIPIAENETGGSLHDKLTQIGGQLILETLKKLEDGTAVYTKQQEEQSCYAKMLTKQLGSMDFSKSAAELERLVRGLNPWPSAYTSYKGKTMKVWQAECLPETEAWQPAKYGEIVELRKNGILVKTGNGILMITELQLEGKKRMEAEAFLRGFQMEVGAVLAPKA